MGTTTSRLFETDPLLEDKKSGKGPLGIGDPEDRTLRAYEKRIHLPAVVEITTRQIKCRGPLDNANFCTDNSFFALYTCAEERSQFNQCMTAWDTQAFREECAEMYIKYRSIYRRTGKRRLLNALRGDDTFPIDE